MHESRVAIVCPECDTRALVEPHEIGAKISRHNERMHDGDAVASVAGNHVDRLAEVAE